MSHGGTEDINWYHGKLSREDAEKMLKEIEDAEDGTFLVRESGSSAGDFVLSVLHRGEDHRAEVIHYQVRKHGDDAFFSIDGTTITHGIETLIEYFQSNDRGLRLTTPCRKDPPPHDARRHGHTNLLHRATKEGNYTVVSELLNCGYRNIEAKNQDGQTAVHLASRLGKDDILRKLIESSATVNCRDTAGYTPLHYACQNNWPHTVRILVDEGKANVQIRHTSTGRVPLHEAAVHGHSEVVSVLLTLNAPANPRTSDNETPADLAQRAGHMTCYNILRLYKPPAARTRRSLWDHGTLDRGEAQALLATVPEKDGVFLVRYSERQKGFVLTMQHMDKTYNYQICTKVGNVSCPRLDKEKVFGRGWMPILNKGEFKFIDDGPYLNSLEHVIEHYSLMSDGLPTTLQYPVPPRPKPPVPEIPPHGIASTLPRRRSTRDQSPSTISSNTLGIPIVTSPVTHRSLASITNNNVSPTIVKNDNSAALSDLIPTNQLKLGQRIGEGEFGSVYKGTYTTPDGHEVFVAIKTLRKEENKNEFLREAKVMVGLNHPCIVRLLGVSYGQQLLMVQELVPLGSMLTFLLNYPEQVAPNSELKLWASQIACGMKYLEEQRFVHRDLAARNILLASRHQAKISDFGLSRSFRDEKDYYKNTTGGRWPIKWYAPESFNYGQFSNASDVWSFGVTLWEMFSYGDQPYGGLTGEHVTRFVSQGERLQRPPRCPDDVYRIMEQCWAVQPRDRPTFSELMEKFISDPDYINVKELVLDETYSLS